MARIIFGHHCFYYCNNSLFVYFSGRNSKLYRSLPENKNSIIAANANPEEGTYWKTDYRYFDQYTLEEKEVKHIFGKYENAAISDKL